MYGLFVGEIGFCRETFLYELKWWEIKEIVEGYRKRERTYCMMTRWSTYMMMCSGMADLQKAGIYSAQDLMKFPWDCEEQDELPSDEEIEEERKKLRMLNEKRAGKK